MEGQGRRRSDREAKAPPPSPPLSRTPAYSRQQAVLCSTLEGKHIFGRGVHHISPSLKLGLALELPVLIPRPNPSLAHSRYAQSLSREGPDASYIGMIAAKKVSGKLFSVLGAENESCDLEVNDGNPVSGLTPSTPRGQESALRSTTPEGLPELSCYDPWKPAFGFPSTLVNPYP